MKLDNVSSSLNLLKSAIEKQTPIVTKLAIVLLNTFIVNNS